MKKTILALGLLTMITACTQHGKRADDNPLLHDSGLFMGAPDFSKITDNDFAPAFDYAMKEQLEKIDSICNEKSEPTFENTIVPLEFSGTTLRRVANIFFGLVSADGTDKLQEIEAEYSPKLTAQSDNIYLNDKLFQRVKKVYDTQLNELQGEDKRLLEYYYDAFVRAGANLSPEKKEELKKINAELTKLETQFSQLLLEATNQAYILVGSADSLKGLSEDEINAAKQLAEKNGHKGMYMLVPTNTTQQPELANLDNRDIRHRFFEASVNRCSKGDKYDTSKLITKIAELRAEKAAVLGYKNFASWQLEDQMAKTPNAVYDFLNNIIAGYLPKAKEDAKEIEDFAKKTEGPDFKLEAWDWPYYAEKLKKEKFDLDENMVKPYFVLDSVLTNGLFYAANKMYGLTFKERKDLPVYNDDVHVYDVIDKDGKQLALFYTDYYTRPTKSGGAWMSNWVDQSHYLGTKPVIYNVCNYAKPADGKPALISWDNVETMFHEFGHALHGMFANQKYLSLSGTATPRDFVEMPSQFNEHWASEPSVFKHYAKHYKTGEPMPQELVEKVQAASKFNAAYSLGENLAAVTLDMAWHMLEKGQKVDNIDEFEKQALEKMKMYNTQIPPRYRSPYFRHIFTNGYSAGYYAYLWTNVLDWNIYNWFVQHGGMTSENGQRFRDMIISKGYSEDLNKCFKDFTGLDKPNPDDMLRGRGIIK